MNKIKTILIAMMFLFLINVVYSAEVKNFNISIEIISPTSAKITENWVVDAKDDADLISFKEKILQANVDLVQLEKIDPDLKPHIYINKFSKLTVQFDEINLIVKLEYLTDDLILIKYLDYKDQIIWKFNENLFRQFVESGLYHIPKESTAKIIVNSPLLIGDALPKGIQENGTIIWTGISTNELRLLVIEKKIPKATFNVSDFFNTVYLRGTFYYAMMTIIFLILVLLLFKKKASKNIKSFVRKHSIIKPKKQINDILDIDLINKKD